LHGELAEARPGEHRFDDHGTGEQVGNLQRRDGDDRRRGVTQNMAADHAAEQQALGLRGRHIVAAELFQHGGAGDTREGRHGERAKRDRRQDHRAHAVDAGRGHHAEGDGEQQDQQDAAPEGRHALPDQHERHQEALEPRAAPHRHQDAGRQSDADRDDQRAAREVERVGQARHDDGGDRHALHQRLAEVEARELRQVVEILHMQRPVEAERVAQGLGVLARRALRQHQQGRIAREVLDEEHQRHRPENGDRGLDQAPKQEATHRDGPLLLFELNSAAASAAPVTAPSPLVGEGSSEGQRARLGEGCVPRTLPYHFTQRPLTPSSALNL
jgi:hypothetical protein